MQDPNAAHHDVCEWVSLRPPPGMSAFATTVPGSGRVRVEDSAVPCGVDVTNFVLAIARTTSSVCRMCCAVHPRLRAVLMFVAVIDQE